MVVAQMDALYDNFLAMKIALRDTHSHFLTYSPADITRLLATKRDGPALNQLYELEEMIARLRSAIHDARLASKEETPQ
jgi:hypothetical protein